MTTILQRLREDVAAILEQDPATVGDDDNLIDLGLDSMRAIGLVMQWEERGIPLDFADLAEAPTLASLAAIVEQRQD